MVKCPSKFCNCENTENTVHCNECGIKLDLPKMEIKARDLLFDIFSKFSDKFEPEFKLTRELIDVMVERNGATMLFVFIQSMKMEDDVQEILKEIALKLIKLFDFKGYGRFDFRLSNDNIPYLIDANPNCNIADNSCFAVLAERINLSYEDMIIDLCVNATTSKKQSKRKWKNIQEELAS